MSSNIDTAIPPFGTPTTAGVRNNFTAAKSEIEALQERIAERLGYRLIGHRLELLGVPVKKS